MTKKKILLFIDWFLPGYRAGGPIQSCSNLIEHLKDEFDFSVITRDTDYMSAIPYAGIKSNEWNILPNGIRVFYFSEKKVSMQAIRKLLQQEEYDMVYLNGIFSFYFTLYPLFYFNRKKDKKIIVASRGMLAQSALSVKRTKKFFFLEAIKILKLFDKVLFHVTNNQEEQDVRKVFRNVNIHIASNLPQKNHIREWQARDKNGGSVRLVSIARIAPEKNTKYALEVLLKLKCNVEFDLFGPVYDEKYWDECNLLIKQMPENIKVYYKGSLKSEEVLTTLSNYHFMFMPTTGENFGHIILQSMNAAVPVIISDQTMWKDLQSKNAGWDLPLSSPKGFCSVIDRCSLMGREEYNKISKEAFNFSLSVINNEKSIKQNRELFLK